VTQLYEKLKEDRKMKKLSTLLGILALMTVMVVANQVFAAEEDWPMFHHDLALSGYSPSEAPDDNTILWIYDTESDIRSSPAVVDGKLYIGALDGNLYALNAYNGSLIWTYSTGRPIYSSPAVADGRVYFLSTNGYIYALNADTGVFDWSTSGMGGPWSWSSPAVHDGRVFIAASSGSVYCLDGDTGATIWSTNIGASPNGPITVVNGKVYSGTHNMNISSPTLVALDESTGAIIWTYDHHLWPLASPRETAGMINSNGVAVADGDGDGDLEVYFGIVTWGGSGNEAIALDEATGAEVWTQNLNGWSTSTPAVHDGKIYIGSDDGNVYALDAGTGSVVWTYLTGGNVWASPAVADCKVFFGSWDHMFYAINESDGALIWSYDTSSSRMLGSPAVAYGNVYVGNENGKIYAFGPLPVYVDIKPGSCPNPLNPKSRGVLTVAVLGTEDFDVTTIDPASILLAREGCEDSGVEPLRWNYEDVATPFEGELCDCHDLNGDGYLDLILKFKTQELVATLNLGEVAGEIPLILTGNLKEEEGGTPIKGSDCIKIR